jgi:uncharacterized protein (DUF2237 family)
MTLGIGGLGSVTEGADRMLQNFAIVYNPARVQRVDNTWLLCAFRWQRQSAAGRTDPVDKKNMTFRVKEQLQPIQRSRLSWIIPF